MRVIFSVLLLLVAAFLPAKSYNAEIFKSEDTLNSVDVTTDDGITVTLDNGVASLDEEDVITAKGKAYVVITAESGRKVIFRNDTAVVKELVR